MEWVEWSGVERGWGWEQATAGDGLYGLRTDGARRVPWRNILARA